jgi:enoyl-CoA hydratase
MNSKYVIVEKSQKVATVTINRPEALNALNYDVLLELQAEFHQLKDDRDVKVVVVTGSGEKAFVAGADVAAMATIGPLAAQRFIIAGHRTFDLIAAFPKPVIAAVNGFALGGGLELALSCDYIYAAENAKFGLPEVNLGIIPGWGGTQRLPAVVGVNRAREMIYSGKIIDAAEAREIGLANRIFGADGFLDAVLTEARGIAQKSIIPLSMAKTSLNAFIDSGGQCGKTVEMQSVCICFSSNDQKEGMAAFLEKRKAVFTDD